MKCVQIDSLLLLISEDEAVLPWFKTPKAFESVSSLSFLWRLNYYLSTSNRSCPFEEVFYRFW